MACVQEGARLTAQPPAAECFEEALNTDAWHNCKLILDKMVNYFVLQRTPDESAMQQSTTLCLPTTPVRFDAVLCSTVRDAVDAASSVPLDSVSMVKWLLLPYLIRKEFRQPFLGDGESSEGQICWVCTLQVRASVPPVSALNPLAASIVYHAFLLLVHCMRGNGGI